MKAYRHFLRYSWIYYRGWILDADQPAHVQPGRHMYSPAGPCIARPDHVQPGRTIYSPAGPCLTRPEFTNQTADCIYLNNQSIEMEIQPLGIIKYVVHILSALSSSLSNHGNTNIYFLYARCAFLHKLCSELLQTDLLGAQNGKLQNREYRDQCTLLCRVHQRLIQSGFSHMFGVYSEPIEIVWR